MNELPLTSARVIAVWFAYVWRVLIVWVTVNVPLLYLIGWLEWGRAAEWLLDFSWMLISIYIALRWTFGASFQEFRVVLIARETTANQPAREFKL